MTTGRLCPLCKVNPLIRHCPKTNAMCDWARCRSCGVTLDMVNRRGFDKSNKSVTWAA